MQSLFVVAVAALFIVLPQPSFANSNSVNTYCTPGAGGICRCEGQTSCKDMDQYCSGTQRCRTQAGKTICECDKALVGGSKSGAGRVPAKDRR